MFSTHDFGFISFSCAIVKAPETKLVELCLQIFPFLCSYYTVHQELRVERSAVLLACI